MTPTIEFRVFGSLRGLPSPIFRSVSGDLTLPSKWSCDTVVKPIKSYALKLEKVCEIFLRFQLPNTITTYLHSFKTITRFPFYFLSFSQLLWLVILFFFKKPVGTSILKIELKIMSGEKKVSNDLSSPFKEKEKEKVLCLVANGRRRTRFFSTSSHFPAKQLYLNLRFSPLTLRFYFTMVLGRYLRIPSLFLGL